MKILVRILLAFFLFPCILAGCVHAQKIDLSTDEAVLAELQKRVDAKRTELGKTGGSKLNARSVCIERLKESEKVIVVGFFAYDRGCRLDGAFIDSRYFESTDAAFSKNALAKFGWEKAPKRELEILALYWVEKGLLAFSTVLYTKDIDLKEGEFHMPTAVSNANGEVVVTLWTSVMKRKKGFNHLEFRFAKDGNRL